LNGTNELNASNAPSQGNGTDAIFESKHQRIEIISRGGLTLRAARGARPSAAGGALRAPGAGRGLSPRYKSDAHTPRPVQIGRTPPPQSVQIRRTSLSFRGGGWRPGAPPPRPPGWGGGVGGREGRGCGYGRGGGAGKGTKGASGALVKAKAFTEKSATVGRAVGKRAGGEGRACKVAHRRRRRRPRGGAAPAARARASASYKPDADLFPPRTNRTRISPRWPWPHAARIR